MRKNKNVVSAKFARSASFNSIEVTIRGAPASIHLWSGNIGYGTKVLSEIELEEVIAILSQYKVVMLDEHNFPPAYEEMLSDLIKVQSDRYSIKKSDKRAYPWRCTDIPLIETMFARIFNIKDVHIVSNDINCNYDEEGWIYLTLSLKFRDGNKEVGENGR